MREDVKQKHFSTPLRAIPRVVLASRPAFLAERVLVFALAIAV